MNRTIDIGIVDDFRNAFRNAYTSLKKKAKELPTKEITFKPINLGISLVILLWGFGTILLVVDAGVLVATGAGLLVAAVILHSTIVAAEFQSGKEKPKREPKKREGKQKTIDELMGEQFRPGDPI